MDNMTENQKRVMDFVDRQHHNRELDKRVGAILNGSNRVYDNPNKYVAPVVNTGYTNGHIPIKLTTYDLTLKQKLEQKFNIVVNFISNAIKKSHFTSLIVSGCLAGTVGLASYGIIKAAENAENDLPKVVQEYDVSDNPLLGDYDTVEVYNNGEAILRNDVDGTGAREVNGIEAKTLIPNSNTVSTLGQDKTITITDTNNDNYIGLSDVINAADEAEILDLNAPSKTK